MTKRVSVNNRRFSYDSSLRKVARLLEKEVKEGCTTGSAYSYHLTKARECRTLALMQREQDTPGFQRRIIPSDRVAGIRQMIDTDMLVRTDLDTLARLSGYSKSHFIRVFRRLTGRSPHQYILCHRLESAMKRIRCSARSLTEIAFLCGFASDTHLAHAFSKYFGVSPRSVRFAPKTTLAEPGPK